MEIDHFNYGSCTNSCEKQTHSIEKWTSQIVFLFVFLLNIFILLLRFFCLQHTQNQNSSVVFFFFFVLNLNFVFSKCFLLNADIFFCYIDKFHLASESEFVWITWNVWLIKFLFVWFYQISKWKKRKKNWMHTVAYR